MQTRANSIVPRGLYAVKIDGIKNYIDDIKKILRTHLILLDVFAWKKFSVIILVYRANEQVSKPGKAVREEIFLQHAYTHVYTGVSGPQHQSMYVLRSQAHLVSFVPVKMFTNFMQDTYTDNLGSVIDAIQLGRKTGILKVRRGEGRFYEEGVLVFVNGQVQSARVEPSSEGVQALQWLLTWGNCWFSFMPTFPKTPAAPVNTEGMQPRYQETEPPARLLTTAQEQSNRPAHTGGTTDLRFHPSALHTLIPRRLSSDQETLHLLARYQFSRAHRRLLLLIDGHRSVKDLMGLLGRSPTEIYEMLEQLAGARLITW